MASNCREVKYEREALRSLVTTHSPCRARVAATWMCTSNPSYPRLLLLLLHASTVADAGCDENGGHPLTMAASIWLKYRCNTSHWLPWSVKHSLHFTSCPMCHIDVHDLICFLLALWKSLICKNTRLESACLLVAGHMVLYQVFPLARVGLYYVSTSFLQSLQFWKQRMSRWMQHVPWDSTFPLSFVTMSEPSMFHRCFWSLGYHWWGSPLLVSLNGQS